MLLISTVMPSNVIEDIANIVLKNLKTENPALQLLKQRLSETETALNNLLKAIEQGIITSTTKQRMIELEQTRDEIKLKLIKEEIKKPTITKEGLVLWLKHIQSMSLKTKEHKQRLIDIFVNAVYLYDDKLVITFNYKEASKTVTLKEVNGSIIECSGAPNENPFSSLGRALFLSNPKDWHVISRKRVCNRRRRMSSRFSVYFPRINYIPKEISDYIHFFEMITYNTSC